MSGKCRKHMHPHPELVEARGWCMGSSARPSVFSLRRGFFTRVTAVLQEFPTSGFYAGATLNVSDVWSTVSALGLRLKTIPTVFEKAVADSAESSLRAASTLRFFAQSTLPSSSTPCANRRGFVLPLKQGQRLFRGNVKPTGRLDRGWLAAVYV